MNPTILLAENRNVLKPGLLATTSEESAAAEVVNHRSPSAAAAVVNHHPPPSAAAAVVNHRSPDAAQYRPGAKGNELFRVQFRNNQ